MAIRSQILAIGDAHLKAGARRNRARLQALAQIVREARALPALGAIVWAGDLFHERSGIEDRNDLARVLLALADLAPVVIVRGNHDTEGDLDVFAHFRAAWPVHVVTRPTVLRVALATGGHASIACLPYPTEGALVAAGVAPGDLATTAGDALRTILLDQAAELESARARGDLALFAAHATIAGAVTSAGQPLIGAEIALDGALLDGLGNLPKILNHIHAPQTVHGGAVYVGSIAPMDWGETERKRYVVVSWAAEGWSVESRPLDVPPLYHVEGELTSDSVAWRVRRGPDGPIDLPPASWAGAEVRVRVRFAASDAGRLAAARAEILETFAEAAHVEVEPVAVPDRAVRAPEVAAAVGLAHKLRAWATVAGRTTSAGVLAKLAQLEALDPAAVLADVDALAAGAVPSGRMGAAA
jgi:hypothetical protein